MLDVSSADLDNRGGALSGKQSLRLSAANLDNRGGLLTSDGELELTAGRVDSADGGEISAAPATCWSTVGGSPPPATSWPAPRA